MNKVLVTFPLLFLVLACFPEAILNLFVFKNRSCSPTCSSHSAKRIWILRWSILAFCLLLAAGFIAGTYDLGLISIVLILAAAILYGVYLIIFLLSLCRKAFR